MVYYSRYRGPRRFRRRYRRYRKAPGRVGTYKRAWYQLKRDVGKLKDMINVEYKYFDTAISQSPDNTGYDKAIVNVPVQGDDALSRDGRQIRIKSIQFNVEIEMAAAATNTRVRVLLVLFKSSNGGDLTMSNVMVSANNINSLRLVSDQRDYWVIFDKTFVLTDVTKQQLQFKYYKRLDVKTRYNSGNAGTFADVEHNAIHFCSLSDEAANTPTLTGNCRIRYIDN